MTDATNTIPSSTDKVSRLKTLIYDKAVRTAFIAFVILRLMTAVVGWWSVKTGAPQIDYASQAVYNLHDVVFTTQGPVRNWLEPWYRWDGGWYILVYLHRL